MSGIAGILCPQASAEWPRLVRIHEALAHRGESHSTHSEGPLGLSSHTRAEAASAVGPQPRFAHGCWVVADARLDNSEKIRAALPGLPRDASAAEVIACAYAQWGLDCLDHLQGDFAFVLWDTQRRRLLAARDPLGVCPLFYRWHSPRLTWASEVKALLADPDYSRAPDEAMLAEHLLGWSDYPDAGATFYRGIRQLPAGHYVTLEDGRLEVRRYWDIEPAEEARYRRPAAENTAEFGALLARAVAQRLADAGPAAVLLSGGLDSTSISSLAERQRNGGAPLLHLCSYFVAPLGDERGYVHSFEEKYGVRVDYLPARDFRVLAGLEESAEWAEGPFLDLTWSLTRQWAAHLAAAGRRTALTGFGGDNIFPDGGPSCCAHVWRQQGWRAGWRSVQRTAARYGLPPRPLLGETLRWLLPDALKQGAKRWLGSELPPWLDAEFARRSGLLERLRRPRPRRGFSSRLQELDYWHLTSGRLALYLGYLDRVGAAHGVDFRHPFLDPALVRLTLLAPPEQKFQDGETKLLLRQALAGIVPEAVRQRPGKGGPGHFLASWIRRHEAEEWRALARASGWGDTYLHPRQAEAVVERLLRGDDTLMKTAWTMLTTRLWLRSNFASA